jgi:hypothetical protein
MDAVGETRGQLEERREEQRIQLGRVPCPYFEEPPRCRCVAVEGSIVPTIHERTLHCRGDHEGCRTFRARTVIGEPIPVDLYEQLWFATPQ